MDDRHDTLTTTRETTRMQGNFSERFVRGVGRHGPAVAGHAIRVTLWGVVHFCFVLVQQLAELLAPLLLIAGIGWYALPRIIGMIQTDDGQMHDIVSGVAGHVPASVTLGGHTLTASGLIVDGLLLMVVAAGLSTLTAVLANELYRQK